MYFDELIIFRHLFKGILATSTCGATISTNTTYIRNPGYPSPHTATSASSCSFTIRKCDPEVCQLRLDFQTFSGFATDTTEDAKRGTCLDTFTAEGQTGKNPPDICGTNTGYHSESLSLPCVIITHTKLS